MGRYVFKLADVGEGMAEAEITHWHVAAGDSIEEDQPLVDVSTDKTVVEIPAPVSGKVISIHGALGEKVPVGSELAVIETDAKAESKPEPSTVTATPAAPVVAKTTADTAALAAPAVRGRARKLGIDLHLVKGSGPDGRITHEDLDSFIGRAARPAPIPADSEDKVEEHRIVGVRRRIAERMQEAKRHIPHFSYVEEVEVSALEELRQELKLTPLPFIVLAIVRAVRKHPEINARFDDEKGIVHRHTAVHVGIATQTPHGLLVPVLRNAQARDLRNCAAEMKRLADAAREGSATREELSGSTITVTSLGALGGVASTPIINYPEVAIVGVNRIVERAVVRGGAVVVRKMMNLSSSFDHRVVDGWNAAAFIQEVKGHLEQPAKLFL